MEAGCFHQDGAEGQGSTEKEAVFSLGMTIIETYESNEEGRKEGTNSDT